MSLVKCSIVQLVLLAGGIGLFAASSGATRPPDSRFALLFDGVDDYVELPDWSQSDLRLEAWFLAEELNGVQMIVARQEDIRLGTGLTADDKLAFIVELGAGGWTTLESNQAISTGVWYHVLATYDHAEMKIFINGEPDAARSATGEIYRDGCTGFWSIGAEQNSCGHTVGGHWNGLLDEVSVGTYSGQLEGDWRFEEGQGQIAADISGNGRHGQLGRTPNGDTGDPAWFKLSTTVEIDIKPGNDSNPINPRANGKIKVAILTTSVLDGDAVDFDAWDVDPMTVTFGPMGASVVNNKAQARDVDHDGDLDMVLQFSTQETGIACGDMEASLAGETFDGESFEGTDSIETVACRCVQWEIVSLCPADLDGDDIVGFQDLVAVLAAWANEGGPEDLDGSGTVDFGDLLIVLDAWGPCE